MAIIFDEKKRTFTLHTFNTSYQMMIDNYGILLHLYYGQKSDGCMDYLLTYYDRGFSGNINEAGNQRNYSMDVLPQEFPCRGTGDFRSPAADVRTEDGIYGCDFRYESFRIYDGKYNIPGLPAVYAGENEAQTLEIVLKDRALNLKAVLYYGVLPELDMITRSVRLLNESGNRLFVEKLSSACLDFVSGKYDIISFYGRHCMERNYERNPLAHGNYVVGSRRGTSSHQYNPMVILAQHTATEESGSCYGMALAYSGGFKAEAEKDQFNQTRLIMGLMDEQFSYPLKPGQDFYAPETVMTYSGEGFQKLTHNYHRCFKKHLCRGKYKDTVRPVLVNSWEAFYFDFDGEALLKLAKKAAQTGIELLVLDDGWFGDRCDDNRALGDWDVNEEKLKSSLGSLAEKINSLGLKFGLWIEPEMISENSRLYREHSDWALAVPGRKPIRSRNQLVLDFSRKEVVDYIFEKITAVLDKANVEYIKWDMNRSISDVYSHTADYQGGILYDYVLGVYNLLERLIKRYPDMLIEGCSGGGGRFDAGMLYYTPQIWCSDNTDAVDRVFIQYGTSFAYPISSAGAHVSVVPNHQTGRSTDFSARGTVAMAGTFGYELNLCDISSEEQSEIKAQIEAYHRFAPLVQNGLYYRLTNPFEDSVGAWAFVSEDGCEALIQAVTLEIHGNMPVNYIKLRGLSKGSFYEDTESGRIYSADALMSAGFPLPVPTGEYKAYQYYFKKVKSL